MNNKRRCKKRKQRNDGDVYLNRIYCLIITIYRTGHGNYEKKNTSVALGSE